MSRRSSGEGSIVRRPDGRWCAALQVGNRRQYVYGKTRSEVAGKLQDLRGQAVKAGGRLPDAGKLTLAEYLTDWLEQAEPRLRPKTHERYEGVLRLHVLPRLGAVTLKRVSPLLLSRHYATLRKTCGARTIQIAHRLIRKALGDAERWGLLATNPAALVDSPTAEPKEATIWTPEQCTVFARAMLRGEGGQYGNLFAFLLASGCRMGEAFGLRWPAIDWQAGTVHIERQITFCHHKPLDLPPKTSSGKRTLALPALGLEALKRQRTQQAEQRLSMGEGWRGDDHVFTSETGYTPTPSNVRRGFYATCKRLGLPAIRVHDLRHVNLSLLAMHGVPVKVAQRRAGHANASVTMEVYQHYMGDGDREAAAILDCALARGGAR